MEGTDGTLKLLTEQPGGGGESPVFGIPCQDHNDGAEISASTEPLNADDNGQDDDDSDFEFASASNPSTIHTADEIFSHGSIRPVYPVFDRELFLYYQSQAAAEKEQHRDPTTLRDLMMLRSPTTAPASPPSEGGKLTSRSVDAACSSSSAAVVQLTRASSFSSSDADDLDGVPAETYCLWAPGSVPPSPDQLGRKSRSTGRSTTNRWRLRDFVLGRSHSDGRQKLMFFHHQGGEGEPANPAPATTAISSGEDAAPNSKNKHDAKDQGKKKPGCSSCKDHPKAPPPTTQRKKKPAATEIDLATAHRLFYHNHTNNPKTSNASSPSPAAASADTHVHRRPSTFLPYRNDLFVGIFPHSRTAARAMGFGFHQPPAPPSFYGL